MQVCGSCCAIYVRHDCGRHTPRRTRELALIKAPHVGHAAPRVLLPTISTFLSPYLHEVSVGVKGEAREYLIIHDVEGLISLVQWVSLNQLIDGAQEVRQRMQELGLSDDAMRRTHGN